MPNLSRINLRGKRTDLVLSVVRASVGFWSGVLVTIPCSVLAWFATGLGHGDQWLTKLIFPYCYYRAYFVKDFDLPNVLLCLCQFSLYGVIIALSNRKGAMIISDFIVIIHIIMLILIGRRTL
jgi:hypothetical protein